MSVSTSAVRTSSFLYNYCTIYIVFQYTDYPKHDNDSIALMFKEWKRSKKENIMTYRDRCFKSPNTGTVGCKLYAPWIEAKDDTIKGFLKS